MQHQCLCNLHAQKLWASIITLIYLLVIFVIILLQCDHLIENRQSCSSSSHSLFKGFHKEASGKVGVSSNEHLDSLSHHSITEMCHHTCVDILKSETFTSLCKLLFENFHEIKIDRFFDFTLINSRIKAGVYNHCPWLLLSDVQQVSSGTTMLGCFFQNFIGWISKFWSCDDMHS